MHIFGHLRKTSHTPAPIPLDPLSPLGPAKNRQGDTLSLSSSQPKSTLYIVRRPSARSSKTPTLPRNRTTLNRPAKRVQSRNAEGKKRKTGAYHHPALNRIDSFSSVFSDAYVMPDFPSDDEEDDVWNVKGAVGNDDRDDDTQSADPFWTKTDEAGSDRADDSDWDDYSDHAEETVGVVETSGNMVMEVYEASGKDLRAVAQDLYFGRFIEKGLYRLVEYRRAYS